MKRRILALVICIGFIGGFLSIPHVSADSTATLSFKIYRILGLDPIEDVWGQGEADWYYYVGVSQDGSTYTWKSSSMPVKTDANDVIVNTIYTFSGISTTTVTIAITLLEDDVPPFDNGDDVADISSDPVGGMNDVGDPIPAGIRGGTYIGYYNLKTNVLTGDQTTEELGYHKTSGEYDLKTGDQNDAAVYFDVWDNYDAPKASIIVSDTSVKVGDLVNFDGSGSAMLFGGASAGSIISRYQWDFNYDGVWDAEGATASFTYNKAGTYTVQLKVTDSLGAIDTDTRTIYVSTIPPIASFSYSPLNPTTLDTIQFTDTSNDQDGTIASWYWSFGDLTTSADNDPTHSYTAGGTYTVSLTVIDNDGASNTETKYITVIELGKITGTVKDVNGNPISSATIKLFNAGATTVLETATTNANGVYTISEIATGTYDIEASKSGYDNNKNTNKIIYSGENTVNFVLTGSSSGNKGTPGFEIILVVCAIALVLLLKRKKIIM